MVVELSRKLVQERLDLEQQLEDMQATHQTKMEQMSSRVKQLGSCQPQVVEQLSGIGPAVIQDVKMLRQQFRKARQEVDSLEDQLKVDSLANQLEVDRLEDQLEVDSLEDHLKEMELILERFHKQLKYNMTKVEEEQIMLGQVLKAGLHPDRVMVERRNIGSCRRVLG